MGRGVVNRELREIVKGITMEGGTRGVLGGKGVRLNKEERGPRACIRGGILFLG